MQARAALDGNARAHQLGPDARHEGGRRLALRRSLYEVRDVLILAGRPPQLGPALGPAHVGGQGEALGDEVEQGAVHRVDALADVGQVWRSLRVVAHLSRLSTPLSTLGLATLPKTGARTRALWPRSGST